MPCTLPFRSIYIVSLWILFACVAALPAHAQSALTGVVSDESGGAINAVTITVRDASGAVAQTTTTDANGAFSLPVLPPGR